MLGAGSSHSISPTIDTIAGLLSLALAYLLATGRPLPFADRRARRGESAKATAGGEPKDPWSKRMLERDSLAVAFGLGILIDLPSVWYLAALKDIAEAGHSTGADIALVLLFNAIMFVLVEVPLAFYVLAPERAAAAAARSTNGAGRTCARSARRWRR